jgi:hypothetical protein
MGKANLLKTKKNPAEAGVMFYFGSRMSEVQILSPRPVLQPYADLSATESATESDSLVGN